MARLPKPGTDGGTWGNILNDYLTEEHHPDGTHKVTQMLAVPSVAGKVLASDPGAANGVSWQDTGALFPAGGTSGQALMLAEATDENCECVWQDITKATIGLENVTNDLQLRAADLDTDPQLTAASDTKIPSQSAVKQYVDTSIGNDPYHLPKTGGTLTGTTLINGTYPTGTVGLVIDRTFIPASHTSGRAWGMQFKQKTAGPGNFTDPTGIVGFEGFASHEGTGTVQALSGSLVYARNNATGTVTNLTGMLVFGNQNLGGGTVTNSYNLKINSPNVTAGSITHNYGLYIHSHNQGTGSNYAIYTNAGQVRFGDTVIFDGGITTKRSVVNDSDYTVVATDHLVAVVSLTAPRTITLPVGQGAGKTFVIKDESGLAGTHNITLVPGSGTIEGAASKVISTNFGSLKIYYNGANWFIIS